MTSHTEQPDALHPDYKRQIAKRPLDENDFHEIWEKLGGNDAFIKTFGYYQYGFAVMDETIRKLSPATANKAAEEGGLPDFKIYSVIDKAGWDVDDNYKDELYKLCKAAIAADRASRQVANKAEVEPVTAAYVNFETLDCVIGFGGNRIPEGYWPVATIPFDTPPATTGASTGLTDEWVEIKDTDAARAYLLQWMVANFPTDQSFGVYIQTQLAGDFAYQLARALAATPVAAQAGQVAPTQPTEAMLNAARDWSVKKYGQGIGNDAAIGCWKAMLAAAPSAPEVAQQAPAATIDTREFRELLAKAMDAAELATRTGDPHRDYKPARDALVAHIDARLGAQASTAGERQEGGAA